MHGWGASLSVSTPSRTHSLQIPDAPNKGLRYCKSQGMAASHAAKVLTYDPPLPDAKQRTPLLLPQMPGTPRKLGGRRSTALPIPRILIFV
ncbi:MAG: hypothetical protein WDW38_006634 [Sanguina aurantia]